MTYEILYVLVSYNGRDLDTVTVVWKHANTTRATCANTKVSSAYYRLKKTDVLTEDLLQKVAGYGFELSTDELNKILKNIKNAAN